MIVVAITGIIIAIAAYTWMSQRAKAQQRVCQENLFKVDGAKQQWALELNKAESAVPTMDELAPEDGGGYLQRQPVCPSGGTYTINSLNVEATCTINSPLDHNEKT